MAKKAIVIDSDKEELEKQKKKWEKVREIGNTAFKISSSGFIITMLSPFDFEGPVAEILTAVGAAGGFIAKKVADSKLKELNGQESKLWTDDDDKDLAYIASSVGNIKKSKESKQLTAAYLAKESTVQPETEENKSIRLS